MRRANPLTLGLVAAGLVAALALAQPSAAQTVYVAVGDSITSGTGDEAPNEAKGYPPRLEALLNNAGQAAMVRNEGVPGQNTDEAVLEINQVLGRGGDVMLLMLGTNDVSRDYPPGSSMFNLNVLVGRAQARGLEVIQATVIPRIPRAVKDPNNEINQSFNQRVRDQAGFAGRRLADIFEIFSQETNLFARLYDKDLTDNVGHPNAAGYDLLAQTFFQAITNNDRVPPVLGASTPSQAERRVSGAQRIEIDVWDFGAGIDADNTRMLINGNEVATSNDGGGRILTLSHQPPTPLAGVVRVGLRARDLANPPNQVNREILKYYTNGIRFVDGDLNRDGRVDGLDMVTMARAFGSRSSDPGYRFAYDLNDDLIIDGGDLAILAANFGRLAT